MLEFIAGFMSGAFTVILALICYALCASGAQADILEGRGK